jgi:hypothetical protein
MNELINKEIIHVSSSLRSQGHTGGVPKFASYLETTIGCKLILTKDIPLYLNKTTIFIVDGADGLYTIPKENIIISIVHGTWKEFAIRTDKLSRFKNEINKQHEMWTNRCNYKVAVSPASAYYLKNHHGVEADKIILNGIDLNEFCTKEINNTNQKPIVIHCANDYNKGKEFIEKLQKKCTDFEFEYLNAAVGEESEKFRRGDLFLQLSQYEGNSYALSEGISSGLPVLATKTGVLETSDENEFPGLIIPWQESRNIELVINKLHELWELVKNNKLPIQPRQWAEKYADFNKFKKEWIEFINGI